MNRTIVTGPAPPSRGGVVDDIAVRIIKANEKFVAAANRGSVSQRYWILEQLDALVDLATTHGLGRHLAPSRRLIKALGAIDLGSFDPILARITERNPGSPPRVTQFRAYMAASADWFVKGGRTEEEAAAEAAREAERKNVGQKQVKKWRRQFRDCVLDIRTFSNALGTDRFRYLTSKMPLGCKTPNEVAVLLARATKLL
jgi:hypothetical protein